MKDEGGRREKTEKERGRIEVKGVLGIIFIDLLFILDEFGDFFLFAGTEGDDLFHDLAIAGDDLIKELFGEVAFDGIQLVLDEAALRGVV